MSGSVFDIALEKRYSDSPTITLVEVGDLDNLLILNQETGTLMRIPVSVLSSAMNAALTGSQIISKLGFTPENLALRGVANGYAPLGSDQKVPSSFLPAYVDDVLEYATTSIFPTTGESGKIYVALDTNRTYRWGGSSYTEISPSPGSTDSVPEGAANLYHTTARAASAAPVQSVAGKTGTVTLAKGDVGLGNVNNTADSDKPVSTAQQTALDLKANKALESWIAPTFENSWVNFGGAYNTAAYYKDPFGIVHLKGLIASGTLQAAAFTLPAGYRPSGTEVLTATSNESYGQVRINSSGQVIPFAGSNAYYSLDGLTFRAT